MTLQDFAPIYAMLSVQLGDSGADEIKIRAFYEALKDLDVELVAMAAQRLGRTSVNENGEAWMPKAPEWRRAAQIIERERVDEQQQLIRRRRIAGLSPLCEACGDTGFAGAGEMPFRVAPCTCRKLRRLEVLGRRPMPGLPSGDAA